MKIRNKIALIFVMLTALLLLSVFLFIYFSVEHYTEEEFYLRLKQRASIAAQAYLEEDELSTSIYEEIRKKHLQTLPNEKEKVFKVNVVGRTILSADKFPLDMKFFDEVLETGKAEITKGTYYYTAILYNDNQGDFVVVLSAEDLYGTAKMQNLLNTLLTAYILSLLILFVIGRYYAKEILKPISDITDQVNKIKAKNLHLRLANEYKNDELGELSRTFNSMLDRLETSFEMKSSFVHNASHELKNPLTAIIGQTEVALGKARSAQEYLTTLKTIEKEALRLDELINALFELAHTEHDAKSLIVERIRADELVVELKKSFDTLSVDRMNFNFQLLPKNSDKLVFHGNQSLIKVALFNILDNALKYSKKSKVDLSIEVVGKTIIIVIKDEGIGIPKEELESVCEPFYRASNARAYKGFGFGLALAQKIIRLHNGRLKVYSEITKGTLVVAQLPNINKTVA